jgi:hypothetical protein
MLMARSIDLAPWRDYRPYPQYTVGTVIPASGELNNAMPPVAMLPSLLGARTDVVSLIVAFVALALIVLFLRLLAEAEDR